MDRIKAAFTFILLLTVGMCLASGALAKDYYVSKDGSDSNPGTQTKPWLTIQHAADTMIAGDSVHVSAGTYNERVVTKAKGGQDDYIRFRVSGTDVVTMGGFEIDHDWIYVEGFHVTGTLTPAYSGYIDFSPDSDYCVALHNKLHDGEPHIFGARFHEGSAHCAFVNNQLDKLDWIYVNIHGSDHLVEGNYMVNCPGWDAVRFFGNGHIVRGNFFKHIDKTGANHTDLFQTFGVNGDDCYDILVECNLAVDCDTQIGNFEANNADIRDFTFRNNVFINITSTANMFCERMRWYNNTFYNCSTRNNNTVLSFSSSSGKGVSHDSVCKNNMFIGCGGINDPNNGWYSVHPDVSGFDADYNYVAQKNGQPKNGFSEPHGINGGDPKFIDLTGGDLHIAKDSPAVGSGLAISGFNHDKDGELRSQIWDIGAYEFLPDRPVNLGVDY
jgi:hypothetical protein